MPKLVPIRFIGINQSIYIYGWKKFSQTQSQKAQSSNVTTLEKPYKNNLGL